MHFALFRQVQGVMPRPAEFECSAAGRTKAGAVGAGLADIGKRSSGVQLRGCALYQHGASARIFTRLPGKRRTVIDRNARVIERELRRLRGSTMTNERASSPATGSPRAVATYTIRPCAREDRAQDPNTRPGAAQFDFQTRLSRASRSRPARRFRRRRRSAGIAQPSGSLRRSISNDRPPGPVEELDDGVGGDGRL